MSRTKSFKCFIKQSRACAYIIRSTVDSVYIYISILCMYISIDKRGTGGGVSANF